MARHTGVYRYETRNGTRWRWKADVNGKRDGRKAYLTEKAAAEARALWMAEQYEGLGLAGGRGRTLDVFFEDDWLPRRRARAERVEIRSSTVELNEAELRNHVLPTIGHRRLRDVTVEDVERLGDELTAKGLAPDTVRRVLNTLGLVLQLAVKWRHAPYNPVRDAEKPAPRRRKPDIPTLEDVHRLAGRAPTPDVQALVLVAAYSGIRKAEAFGLRWENVDLAEGDERLRVVEQFYKGELVPSAKTRAGNRELVLAPQAADVLRELSVGQQVDGRPNPHGLVFPSPTGARWHDSNFDRRVWRPMCEAAGLAGLTFHTLRFFYVSHVRAQGLPSALSEQLTGHVDERTHRGYTRPIAGTEPIIREALSRAFGGAA
jgi:integrase